MHPLFPPIDRALRDAEGTLIQLRRAFHAQPELSLEEHHTAERIASFLEEAGLEVRSNVGGTGVVGVLRGDRPGGTVAYRADIDALPLQETAAVPFRSQREGCMHACGHDGHVAVALMMAKTLAQKRTELTGTVVFLFQPAEEIVSGAKPMIESGVLEDPRADTVLGLHLINYYPSGSVVVRPGPLMASVDAFEVDIQGRGGHGAMPHLSVDPITVASHIVVGLQDLVSREIPVQERAVVTVGQIHSGSKHNIIPDTATLGGTIRTYSDTVRDQLIERLAAFSSRMAQAYRAEARLVIKDQSVPPVENDPGITELARQGAESILGADALLEGAPMMGSDDMSLFLRERPGCYLWIGAGVPGETMHPHHHPGFAIDERCLLVGLRVATRAVLDALIADPDNPAAKQADAARGVEQGVPARGLEDDPAHQH